MRTIVITMSVLSLLLLAGCGSPDNNPNTTAAVHTDNSAQNSKYGGMTPVPWLSMTTRAQQAVRTVAERLGNDKPDVALVLKTKTDSPPHQLMYVVVLKGHFIYRNVSFVGVVFSVLGTGTQAWGFTSQRHIVRGVPATMVFHHPNNLGSGGSR